MTRERLSMTPEQLSAFIDSERARQEALESREKGVPKNVRLGPLGSAVIRSARWKGEDKYPAYQGFADELENLLSFTRAHSQYGLYFSKLTATVRQRDAALDELRVAIHLEATGFSIVQWSPIGKPPKEGEYLVCGPSAVNTFVEVKSPTWQSELSGEEIRAGRTKLPKYRFCEGRPFAHWSLIQDVIYRAYAKFSPKLPNLLVIVGDGPRWALLCVEITVLVTSAFVPFDNRTALNDRERALCGRAHPLMTFYVGAGKEASRVDHCVGAFGRVIRLPWLSPPASGNRGTTAFLPYRCAGGDYWPTLAAAFPSKDNGCERC